MQNERNALSMSDAAVRMRAYRARRRGEAIPLRKPGPRPKPREATIVAHPGADRGYALDFSSPMRLVATKLDEAGRRGLTVTELAASYRHSNPNDLVRVKIHHGCVTDTEAVRFLIDRALSALGVQRQDLWTDKWGPGQIRAARRAGAYRLAVPFDDLRDLDGHQIHRYL